MSHDQSVFMHLEDGMSQHAEATLEHVGHLMPQLIRWLIQAGVGYNEFIIMLKKIFYNEALDELNAIGQKKTDSAISLLSGLNRRDVRTFCENYGEYTPIEQFNETLPVSVPARVIGLWIDQQLPMQIPLHGKHDSFEGLVRQVSSEKHPKSILLELKRLGVVQEQQSYVNLQHKSFTLDSRLDESRQLFIQNISDHLAAGMSNLNQSGNFLEQAVFADELSLESIEKLNKLSVDLWMIMSKEIVSAALECCRNDEHAADAIHKFRVGIYEYHS